MCREPGSTRRKHAPCGTIDRTCHTPEVGIMMSHPTLTTIHILRRLRACLTQITNHREEWLLRFSDVSYKGRPVVHLGIDIDGVLRIPRCIDLSIPDALQIGRLSTGLRRRDQQITAILHHQRYHAKIAGILLEGCQTLVCRQSSTLGLTRQIQIHSVVLLTVFLQMGIQQLLVSLALYTGQRLIILLHRATADIVIIHEVGSSSDVKRSSGGISHTQFISTTVYLTISLSHNTAFRFQSSLDTFMIGTVDNCSQLIDRTLDAFMRRDCEHLRLQRTGKIDIERQRTFLSGFQLYDDDIISLRSKDRPLVFHTFIYIRGRCQRITQIQLAVIVSRCLVTQLQLQRT